MSIASDQLEHAIRRAANAESIPNQLPQWLLDLGITQGTGIIASERIGGDRNNKTDVIIRLQHSNPIKISAKLSRVQYTQRKFG
ncbi:hypothetical protein [Paenibacillus sp. MMS18-CY102]|uniref:hypothetical protein n=1 Tax=Paenibacillus sp. MMS18-CY102 TaxID=2682849 RepID=UPI00136597B2|nr:hypothetical protein [Paenibacillus sp. MMS18-CY102]MWC30797.1 hypothetical protein [Paenibacillus sp. MMS18-CY102]